jgi:formate dehydrogenase major subunit
MDVNRRQFIQITGATAAGLAVGGLGFDLKPVKAHAGMLKTKYAKETTTICCYCAVGCGAIVHTSKRGDGRVINIEGDPDHVINRGALCSKGASLKQLAENENRLTQPMYRAPYADKWQSVSWDWALEKIAHRVKETRDASFTAKNDQGPDRQPDHGHCIGGQRCHGQRGVLALPGPHAIAGAGVRRTPGAHLTQRHGCGSGRVVRTRCDDQSLDRYQKQRLHSYHGKQRR